MKDLCARKIRTTLANERQLRKIFKVLIVTFEYFTEKNLQGGWEGERETRA